MRGLLSDEELEIITRKITKPEILKDITHFDPDTLAMVFGPHSTWPEAFVCLKDAIDYIDEAALALSEMEANYTYYSKKEEQRAEFSYTKIFTARYYADDVSLRLYSGAEHLANFLRFFYNIPKIEIDEQGKDSTTSLSIKIGKYFMSKRPKHPVRAHLLKLINEDDWKFIIKYRNNWVHNQRPLLKDYGIQHKRRNRWKSTDEHSSVLALSFGDIPDIDINTLMNRVHSAFTLFTSTTSTVFEVALKEIEQTPQYVSKGNWKLN